MGQDLKKVSYYKLEDVVGKGKIQVEFPNENMIRR